MIVTRVVTADGMVLHEFPDCKIGIDDVWVYIIPTGVDWADRKAKSIFTATKAILHILAIYTVEQESIR